MVSHPETGSDSPIGSDRDRGRDMFNGRSQNPYVLMVDDLQNMPKFRYPQT